MWARIMQSTRIETLSLPQVPSTRRKRNWTPGFRIVQRSMLLDPAAIQSDACNVTTGKPSYENGLEFGGVTLRGNCVESAAQAPCDDFLYCSCESPSRARPRYPYEMPAGLTDNSVEIRSRDVFHMHPTLAKRSTDRIQMARQYAGTS